MYSEKVKDTILDVCFKDRCVSLNKENSGLAALTAMIPSHKGIIDKTNLIFISDNDKSLTEGVYLSGKTKDGNVRFRLVKKLPDPYNFEVSLDGEILSIKKDQYKISFD